jgi:eukaryotic-like serine/threonine-protein kinase
VNSHEERIAGYQVLSVLGYGANSTIFAVNDPKDSKQYALKRVVRKDQADQRFIDQMVNEYKVSTQINHSTIRRCHALKKKRSLFTVQEAYLVMELVPGQNLVQRRPATLAQLARVFLVTCDALIAVNKAGYVHADMKPNNIIMDDKGGVKIIDLGQSCPIGTVKTRIQGTPDYIAPEQVKRRPLTAQTDMFNFGATMYWCVTDRHIPTLIPDETERRNEDRKFYPASHYNADLPQPLDALIRDCLRSKPIDRPESWETLRSRLELISLKLDREQPTRAASPAAGTGPTTAKS